MTSKTTTAGSDTDRQAILDVLAGLYKAWEAGDAEPFVADYTDDAGHAGQDHRRSGRRRGRPLRGHDHRLDSWPKTGIPDNPRAWLAVVARRKALDQRSQTANSPARWSYTGTSVPS